VRRLAARFRNSQKYMQDDPWAKRAAGERSDLHQHIATVRPAPEFV
jgi:nitrite reductase (NADH) large subunit